MVPAASAPDCGVDARLHGPAISAAPPTDASSPWPRYRLPSDRPAAMPAPPIPMSPPVSHARASRRRGSAQRSCCSRSSPTSPAYQAGFVWGRRRERHAEPAVARSRGASRALARAGRDDAVLPARLHVSVARARSLGARAARLSRRQRAPARGVGLALLAHPRALRPRRGRMVWGGDLRAAPRARRERRVGDRAQERALGLLLSRVCLHLPALRMRPVSQPGRKRAAHRLGGEPRALRRGAALEEPDGESSRGVARRGLVAAGAARLDRRAPRPAVLRTRRADRASDRVDGGQRRRGARVRLAAEHRRARAARRPRGLVLRVEADRALAADVRVSALVARRRGALAIRVSARGGGAALRARA